MLQCFWALGVFEADRGSILGTIVACAAELRWCRRDGTRQSLIWATPSTKLRGIPQNSTLIVPVPSAVGCQKWADWWLLVLLVRLVL